MDNFLASAYLLENYIRVRCVRESGQSVEEIAESNTIIEKKFSLCTESACHPQQKGGFSQVIHSVGNPQLELD